MPTSYRQVGGTWSLDGLGWTDWHRCVLSFSFDAVSIPSIGSCLGYVPYVARVLYSSRCAQESLCFSDQNYFRLGVGSRTISKFIVSVVVEI